MVVYGELLQVADKILEGFHKAKLQRGEYGYFIHYLGAQKGSWESTLIITALDKLATDGYLNRDGTSNNYFNISGEGHQFMDNGGYEEYVKKINTKEGRDEIIEQSILDTNTSVRSTNTIQGKSIKWNAKLFWITLAVAVAGALASWLQVLNDSEKRELRHKLQDTSNLLHKTESTLIQKEGVLSAQQIELDSLKKISGVPSK